MDTECNSNIVCHIGTNSIALQLQAILFKLVTASFSQSIGQFFLTVVFFEHNTVSIKFDILCTLQLKKNQSQNSLPIRIRKLACSFVNINQRKKEIHSSSNHTTQNSQNKQTKISDLETNIFELNMMVKSGLVFFILKFYQPLQSWCCPVQKKLPGKAELAWQVSR